MTDIRKVVDPNLPMPPEQYNRQYQEDLLRVLRLYFATLNNAVNAVIETQKNRLELIDGITEPGTVVGKGIIYVDSADGDLKIRFGDGTIKTIITDT